MRPFVPPPGQDDSLGRMAEARNYNSWLLDRGRRYLGRSVLDLGSGIGTFAELLGTHTEVVAVEPDSEFVRMLRDRFVARSNVIVIEGDVSSPEIKGPFDTIVCLNVLEHIADDGATLLRLHHLLGASGHLLLLVPAHPLLYGRIDENVGHARRYTRRSLRQRLLETGFAVRELRYVNPLGAVGWLVSSKILRREQVPVAPLKLFDAVVPALRELDRLPSPFGLSVWAVATRAET